MNDAPNARPRHTPNVKLPALTALVPAVLVVWHLGWPVTWPALLLPVSLALFTFVWTFGLMRLARWPWALAFGLIVGVFAAHLLLWLPFVFASYLGGHGRGQMGYSALAGLVTAAAVGWYILGAYLWQTVLFFVAVGGVILWLRPRRAGETS